MLEQFSEPPSAPSPRATPRSLSPETLAEILPQICSAATSADPPNWHFSNPLWGHCAVASLLAQKLFGGELLRASLQGTAYAVMGSHYWNRLGSGVEQDFTAAQFREGYPRGLRAEERARSYLLSNDATLARYALLSLEFARTIQGGNSLFADPIYRTCIREALRSPCQKMGFGAVVADRSGRIMAQASNLPIEELRALCSPECIRQKLPHRADPMIGGCGHAEEWAVWSAVKAGVNLGESRLYVAGTTSNGLPWVKDKPEHTCLRCAVMINFAGIETAVPLKDGWAVLAPGEVLRTALSHQASLPGSPLAEMSIDGRSFIAKLQQPEERK